MYIISTAYVSLALDKAQYVPANGTNAPTQRSSAMLSGIKGEDKGEI